MRGEMGKKVFVVAHTPVGASGDEERRRMSSRRAERAARLAPVVNANPAPNRWYRSPISRLLGSAAIPMQKWYTTNAEAWRSAGTRSPIKARSTPSVSPKQSP